jgi:hypothetical protein
MDNLNALMTATEREVLDLVDQLISGLQAAELRGGAPMHEHRAELKHIRQLVLDNVLRRQQVREAEAAATAAVAPRNCAHCKGRGTVRPVPGDPSHLCCTSCGLDETGMPGTLAGKRALHERLKAQLAEMPPGKGREHAQVQAQVRRADKILADLMAQEEHQRQLERKAEERLEEMRNLLLLWQVNSSGRAAPGGMA